jgi:hypothetical protein
MVYSVRLFQIGSIFTLFLLLFGCDRDSTEPVQNDQDYFPLRVGDYRIYRISETQITPYNVEHFTEYEIKTLVTDSFQNNAGGRSYIVSRYKRATQSDTWLILDTWSAKVDSREVVLNESNVPFVKIIFPIAAGHEWNGNAYNSQESVEFCEGSDFTSCDVYAFGEIKSSFETSDGAIFENTVEVIENDSPDPIVRHDVRREIYAFDIGMVYREIIVLKYCTDEGCRGQQKIEDGLVYKQELIEYGHE